MNIIHGICASLVLFVVSTPAAGQDDKESDKTQIEIGAHYKSATTLQDSGSTILAKDIVAFSAGLSKEKELTRNDNGLSLSIEGEAAALYGRAGDVVVNGVDINQSATYRAGEAFGNMKLQQDLGDGWSAFSKAGVGVLYEDLETSGVLGQQQKFQDLSPAARFQAGVEKKVNDRLSIGVSAGTTEKLD